MALLDVAGGLGSGAGLKLAQSWTNPVRTRAVGPFPSAGVVTTVAPEPARRPCEQPNPTPALPGRRPAACGAFAILHPPDEGKDPLARAAGAAPITNDSLSREAEARRSAPGDSTRRPVPPHRNIAGVVPFAHSDPRRRYCLLDSAKTGWDWGDMLLDRLAVALRFPFLLSPGLYLNPVPPSRALPGKRQPLPRVHSLTASWLSLAQRARSLHGWTSRNKGGMGKGGKSPPAHRTPTP